MNKLRNIVAVAGAILLVGMGCNQAIQQSTQTTDNGAQAQPTTPIKVGFISPLTGDAAVYGIPGQNAVMLAVDQINAAGGINGRLIEMVYEDGKCNGKDAATAMQKLVSVDNVKYVIGGFCSSESLAAAPIANDNKVVLLSIGSSSPELTTKGGKYFLRDYPSDAAQGRVLAEVAYNDKGWRTVAVAQEQTDYALGVQTAFATRFKELGGAVAIEQFPSDLKDFRTIVTKLKATKPDALLVSVQTPKVGELVLKQVKDQNWKIALMGSDVLPGSDLPKTNPELVEGMLCAEFGYDANSQKFKDFVTAYKTKFNKDPEYLSYAQTEFDGPMILADALKAAGDDADKVLAWLHAVKDWTGVSGNVSFDEHGDRTAAHNPEVIAGGKVMPYTK
jgi:branched-chain amino acid transport system substrate-binding protein